MTTLLQDPTRFMASLLNNEVVIRLKWGMEYVGTLVAYDERMNIHIRECQEWIGQKKEGDIGDVIIRCNNILYVRPKPSVYPPEFVPPLSEMIVEDDD